ncbi:hypothetical protein K469DRAFT_341775 [Zopfia rhizophila CBS 207.26]|uniref:Uncharacterized protein n=1 Tax=Zopfia rhizophila CBS 207.26 TaxID=1314779 RepID=A0A6A6EK98_9PEZI|nr:hypothetical protein K469DRAFT_341775 [Zopfia rhizophila CBS 207.26]
MAPDSPFVAPSSLPPLSCTAEYLSLRTRRAPLDNTLLGFYPQQIHEQHTSPFSSVPLPPQLLRSPHPKPHLRLKKGCSPSVRQSSASLCGWVAYPLFPSGSPRLHGPHAVASALIILPRTLLLRAHTLANPLCYPCHTRTGSLDDDTASHSHEALVPSL